MTRLVYDKATRTIMREEPCSRCGQPVKRVDGKNLRFIRTQAGIGLRELGRQLKLSAPYLSDVELNRRHATDKIVAEYMKLVRR